ncbi:TadE family protein [Paenarthrobacter sp. NPDC089322]|uniref:TadE/TadG family type IV pilus assembly protein n=1 Tax=Paenarthrobacter sp. NPDC089322 TaxID=3155065 RepID=UPI0034205FEC
MDRASERGAVAVEFALLAPVLVLLVLGIMEFGRAYNAQVTISNAAREGVRVMAISNDQSAARTAAKNAAATLNPKLVDTNFTFSAASCTPGAQMSVTIKYTLSTLTGIAGPFPMQGVGVMVCGG